MGIIEAIHRHYNHLREIREAKSFAKCMRCGKDTPDPVRGLCKPCAAAFKYMYGYKCHNGHHWFSVLDKSFRCPNCDITKIEQIGECD